MAMKESLERALPRWIRRIGWFAVAGSVILFAAEGPDSAMALVHRQPAVALIGLLAATLAHLWLLGLGVWLGTRLVHSERIAAADKLLIATLSLVVAYPHVADAVGF